MNHSTFIGRLNCDQTINFCQSLEVSNYWLIYILPLLNKVSERAIPQRLYLIIGFAGFVSYG